MGAKSSERLDWGSPRLRFLASFLIIGHLLAVATAPLGFQTQSARGNSPSVETLGGPVRGYGEFLYLNRGYAFFAPDPGPSHLFQAAIGDPGKPDQLQQPVFPDRRTHWPRLLYHRHFMLAEYLHEIYQPIGPPPELARVDPAAAATWTRLRARYEFVRQSYVQHLEAIHPDQPIALRRLEHMIPDFVDVVGGSLDPATGKPVEPVALDDPALYRVLFDQSIGGQEAADLTDAEELAAPIAPDESARQPLPAAETPASSVDKAERP